MEIFNGSNDKKKANSGPLDNRGIGIPVVQFENLAMATSAETSFMFDKGTIRANLSFHGPDSGDRGVVFWHGGARYFKPMTTSLMFTDFMIGCP